ncbi:gastric inhibitory polypeptide receptor-like isoform 3-T3 [Cyanocitta cristata]
MGQWAATPAPLSYGPHGAEERSAQATVVAWRQYRQACELHLRLAPPAPVQGGVVARRCGPDGRWVTDDSGRPWQDNSQCEDLAQVQPLQRQAWLLEQFRLLYTVGYSLSLVALVVALLLLLLLRRLRCTRNLIHANLFLSFALRAGAILTRDALLPHGHGHGHPLQLLGMQVSPWSSWSPGLS